MYIPNSKSALHFNLLTITNSQAVVCVFKPYLHKPIKRLTRYLAGWRQGKCRGSRLGYR